MITGTTFSNINIGEYFIFVDAQPKSPEGSNGNVWTKVSFHKIRKFGEQKTSTLLFRKGAAHVTMVAKNLDELIANNPQPVFSNKR